MARKASSKPADSTTILGFERLICACDKRHSGFLISSVRCLAIRGIEADSGMEHANTFRGVQHTDICVDSVFATARRHSANLKAKPFRRVCRRQDNSMPFNDSDSFRKDDELRYQPSGARQIVKGNPKAERGDVHQFGILPKSNANFACVQPFIHCRTPQGMASFVLT